MRRFFPIFGSAAPDQRRIIEGPRLVLRPPRMEDFSEWVALRAASRGFLEPWEPIWPADDLTRGAFRRRIARIEEEATAETGFALLIRARASDQILGGITLSNIRRRAAEAGTLGYWMGEAHAGKGIMSEAVLLLAEAAFSRFRLARLEAACIPENIASIRVLEKAGFQREGMARDYLAIAGRRQNHLLFARLATDPAPIIPASSLLHLAG